MKESPIHERLRHNESTSVADTSYETTLKANRRMSNVEYRMSKDGIALLSLFKIDRIHYSMLDVGCSMFDVH